MRHFDAPEALDTRFYEVRAKSALNRVPERVAHAVPVDDQPVPGVQPRLRLLLRAADPHVPRHGRGAGLRARDRRQGQRPEVVRTELARPSWKGEHIAMGTNTDPYQWVEGRYKLMRGIWEALRDDANPCSVLTKSPLLLRDLDLMLEIAAVTDIAANLSIPTMDEKPWRASEPHTPSPRARMEAVAELNRAGIPTGILVAPLMPGINDDPRQVERDPRGGGRGGRGRRERDRAASPRGGAQASSWSGCGPTGPISSTAYEGLYARGAYAPREEQDRLRRVLATTSLRTGHEPPRRSPADSAGCAAGARTPAQRAAAMPGATPRRGRARRGRRWPGRAARGRRARSRASAPGGRRRCSECVGPTCVTGITPGSGNRRRRGVAA